MTEDIDAFARSCARDWLDMMPWIRHMDDDAIARVIAERETHYVGTDHDIAFRVLVAGYVDELAACPGCPCCDDWGILRDEDTPDLWTWCRCRTGCVRRDHGLHTRSTLLSHEAYW